MEMKAPRGTQDILPGTSEKWQYAEQVLTDLASRFNYKEIRVPIFEHTELFLRGVGETTDIVQKEMYTFKDKGDRSLTLRPEGTASVVRAYVQNKLYGLPEQPTKLFYYGPMFRYERPQQGRMRQFVQFGVEALGSEDPAIDAEVISLAMSGYQQLGLKSLKLIINTLGDKESRDAHRTALIEHFTPVKDELCSDCQNRLEKNPLRILDCKKDREHPKVKSAPSIHDYLNEESKAYFDAVKENLDAIGIAYEVDPNLVRGLDYYNHTAFEIMSNAEGFGALTTLTGGGRYNGLVEEVGGPSTPGIGYALSIERLLFALEAEGIELPVKTGTDVYVVALGEGAVQKEAAKLTYQLRLAGLIADKDYLGKKMKGQFKAADRQQAKFVVVLGEDELEKGVISLRNMQNGQQTEVAITEAVEAIKEQLDGGKADE
ncbi:histidyl-tRNA synthetase [Terribacillus halophilus]|uniref:Histidine--tRNA ligase n=1 Tax=Terribacillus halophilus TaxID=361279 RepID=A0A1G6SKG8_9BACI|nr:histidine--tRNA ligase [Terribacillus halophilus]SDD17131.1 histidyl-tRNA synthetase [Terribacillus halophilus]